VVVLVTLGLLAASLVVEAQAPSRVPRIGVIGERSPTDSFLSAFRQDLRGLGYPEGQSVVVEYRYAYGALDRVPEPKGLGLRIPASLVPRADEVIGR
jgi:hypothetical protein